MKLFFLLLCCLFVGLVSLGLFYIVFSVLIYNDTAVGKIPFAWVSRWLARVVLGCSRLKDLVFVQGTAQAFMVGLYGGFIFAVVLIEGVFLTLCLSGVDFSLSAEGSEFEGWAPDWMEIHDGTGHPEYLLKIIDDYNGSVLAAGMAVLYAFLWRLFNSDKELDSFWDLSVGLYEESLWGAWVVVLYVVYMLVFWAFLFVEGFVVLYRLFLIGF